MGAIPLIATHQSRGLTFQVYRLSQQSGIHLKPRPNASSFFAHQSPIVQDLDSIWDLEKFKTPRAPVLVADIQQTDQFSHPGGLRVLDMPIKMAGSVDDYRLPAELAPFAGVIQQTIDYEHAMLPPEILEKYYGYLTIDQSWVKAGTTQRNKGAHVDGFQGKRINPKREINHSYVACDRTPTISYPHPFCFDGLDEGIHDFFAEMDEQKRVEAATTITTGALYLIDAYTVHEAAIAVETGYRTFYRLSYDVKKFDRLGNTHNPLFDYDWEMVERDVHHTLQRYSRRTK